MSVLPEDQLEKKLLALKDTHESISSLSSWCLERPQHHKRIVSVWLQVLKKVKIEQRLTLFHLANDVIQYSKRKGFEFVESWGTALQKATTMVRDDKVRHKIERLFKIWDERSIYDEAFLVDLTGLLTSHKPAQSTQEAQDFQPITLISKIRTCKMLEDDTDLKRKVVNDSHLSLNDADALHSFLKDRRHGADLEQELEEGVAKMVDYITALQTEIKDRAALIDLLDTSDGFYDTQRGEAKIVCNAYRNFSKRVDNLKKKLDDLTTSLPSPVPSPDVNAPSPSPESDLDLPEDSMTGKYSTATSFIGTLVMPEHGSQEDMFDLMTSPKDSPPPPGYKPPTPPRSYKRKSSPKYHSPPSTNYISSNTPTLSSSSTSTYSSHSPYQPVSKASSYTPNTKSYTIPLVTYSNSTYSTSAPNDVYSSMYNPEDNELSNSYSAPSPESYHIPGANPPPPPLSYSDHPQSEYPSLGRNPSPHETYTATTTYHQHVGVQPPFYSASDLTMPPLLGEDCPPTSINGLDSFLQGDSINDDDSPNAPPLLGSGFSSFMGNLNLPFDFQQQKGMLFSEGSCVSPPPVTLEDSPPQMDNYLSDSDNDGEGKPIEVINRTKQPDLSEILKAISVQSSVTGTDLPVPSPSVPPPPLPPTLGQDKPWSQPPLLPPKFPTWCQDDWVDTPASPPLYEKSGYKPDCDPWCGLVISFSEPVEFDDTESLALADTDTDLRSLGLQGDIDHRNLISLTSSPRDDPPWGSNQDTDYRKLALAPKREAQDDNVESVDMEMSSDDETETEVAKPVVSFSLASHNKPLVESPLKEQEEPKVKNLLSVALTPPPRLPEPPPLPDVDEIFPELDSGGETEETQPVAKIPSPPLPPAPLSMPILPIQKVQEVQVIGQSFPQQRPRGFFNPRFNNQRQRFPHWQNNQNNLRPRTPMQGPRYHPDPNSRGRPPWFRGNSRPPRFTGW